MARVEDNSFPQLRLARVTQQSVSGVQLAGNSEKGGERKKIEKGRGPCTELLSYLFIFFPPDFSDLLSATPQETKHLVQASNPKVGLRAGNKCAPMDRRSISATAVIH